jgi:hypothetical protein
MAIALIGFLTVLLVLGVGIAVFPRGTEDPVVLLTQGEKAFQEAQTAAAKGVSQLTGDPVKAQENCSNAWGALTRAREGGVKEDVLQPIERQVTQCLDVLYAVNHPRAQLVFNPSDMEPRQLVQGPDKNAFFIDADSRAVWRVEMRNGKAQAVIKERDGRGQGIGVPRLLATGGADLVVLDDQGVTWRWRRPSVDLALLRKPDTFVLGDDALTMEAYLIDSDANLYNLYIADPSENQILRYAPELGGSGFSDASGYLATDNEDVNTFRDMYVDQSLFTLTADNMTRHFQGRIQDFELETPPDDRDIRPGHEYTFVAEYDDKFYVYDKKWSRVLVFARTTGDYLEQWQTTGRVPPMADLVGMYIVPPNRKENPPTLVWMSRDGLYESVLVNDPSGGVLTTPEPEASEDAAAPTPKPTKKPKKTPAG